MPTPTEGKTVADDRSSNPCVDFLVDRLTPRIRATARYQVDAQGELQAPVVEDHGPELTDRLLMDFDPRAMRLTDLTMPGSGGTEGRKIRGTTSCVRVCVTGRYASLARRRHGDSPRGTQASSQMVRKRVEEVFGWMKTVGGFPSGVERTGHGWVLCGYGLQPGADGRTPGGSVRGGPSSRRDRLGVAA